MMIYSKIARCPGLLYGVFLSVLLIAVAACRSAPDPGQQLVLGSPPTAAAYPQPEATNTIAEAYPVPSASATRTPPVVPDTATPPTAESTPADAGSSSHIFLPLVPSGQATATAAPNATLPSPTPIPTLDFSSIRASLNRDGQDLAFNKVGFHGSLLDDEGKLLEWMRQLDEAGVPFFIKSVDNAEPIYLAQQMMKASGVPHTLVFRATGGVPDYTLPPVEAARQHWQHHLEAFPPELDPSAVWIETINEVDRHLSEWLAQFALETAHLAMADGFRWAAFAWAAGEPEPEHWQGPYMLEFLRLAAANPDRLAIALHEGSGTAEDVTFEYPYRTGRFLKLFEIADRHGIPRPTVLITEWGWEYDNIPPLDRAMQDIDWAARLYAPFPQVKGAAIWMIGLGCCFAEISDQVQGLLRPMTEYSLTHYFPVPLPPDQASTSPRLYARP